MVSETMNENVVAFHATDSILDENAQLAQGSIDGLVVIAELGMGVLLALTWLLEWQVDGVAVVVLGHAQIAEVDQHLEAIEPGLIWWQFLFQHGVVVIASCKGATDEQNVLAQGRHDCVLDRVALFLPL